MLTELYARSSFSFLRGASHPEELVNRAAALGYEAIALLDHMGLYGSVRAHFTAKKHGLRALVGATAEFAGPRSSTLSLPLLVKNPAGYRNLCHLLTRLHHRENPSHRETSLQEHCFPLTPFDSSGMVALLTPESLSTMDKNKLLETATCLRNAFGRSNLYITLTRHHRRTSERINRHLVDLADHLKIPLLASNAPLFAHRHDRLLADAFTCLRHHTSLDKAGTLLEENSERHLKSPEQLSTLFKDYPQALLNSQILSERLDFTLDRLDYKFPSYHENGQPLSPEAEGRILRELTFRGGRERYGSISTQIHQQLEHELSLIIRLGFSGYFLIVWEIVQFARSQGILCQGRGSAANSAVCYCLGITACDPVGSGLLFERFLSENRRSWPDIDIDFPSGNRREAVIQHVFQKYSPRGAAMTANVISYRPKSAFREMCKVLDFPVATANRFSALFSSIRISENRETVEQDANSLEKILSQSGVPRNHPRFKPLLHLYRAVLSFPRHLGQHSGGMIISDGGLDSVVPLQPATMANRTIVQWDKDDCEDLGIVKVDLLGLGMLAAMEDSIRICRQRGKNIDLSRIPYDDPATYDLLCNADTIGTFQVESRAQMATLPAMQPRVFYDLVVEVALIRPGPIVGDLVHPYLNRRNGREAIDCIHPDFKNVLERTLGVPLFQEQVLRMAMIIAGFNGSEADELRRAMAFKRSDERMRSISEKLRSRMSRRGIDPHVQERIIDSISSFALYGFPESHAISFALIAYASCWLKVHHPAEFFAGLLNNQPMGFYPVASLLHDARRHGIRIRPVSVSYSCCETTVLDDKALRLGLQHLKNLSSSTAARIVESRSHSQFRNLSDFLQRVRPDKKERRLLAAVGALNDLNDVEHRRDALWKGELIPDRDLFGRAGEEEEALPPDNSKSDSPLPLSPMSDLDRLAIDYSSQNYSTGPHPMAILRREWLRGLPKSKGARGNHPANPVRHPPSLVRASDFQRIAHGQQISCAGLVICRQRPSTANGHCFISLEDETGIANLFVSRSMFDRYRLVITTENFLLCHGRLQVGEGSSHTLYTTGIEPLPFEPGITAGSHDFH
ncbi:MAG: error-prone DNA polymerase [Roseibacillus sp.]|nr:error-prone DNA polymerase [Roseibacillus sp.]